MELRIIPDVKLVTGLPFVYPTYLVATVHELPLLLGPDTQVVAVITGFEDGELQTHYLLGKGSTTRAGNYGGFELRVADADSDPTPPMPEVAESGDDEGWASPHSQAAETAKPQAPLEGTQASAEINMDGESPTYILNCVNCGQTFKSKQGFAPCCSATCLLQAAQDGTLKLDAIGRAFDLPVAPLSPL